MKQIILSVLLMFMFVNVSSAELNSSGLSAEQIAKFQLDIEQAKLKPVDTIEKVDEWVTISERVSKIFTTTLVAMAEQASMSVNEFVKTDVGKLAVVGIMYKVMGETIIGIVGGTLWFIIMLPLWFYFARRILLVDEVLEFEKGVHETGAKKVIKYHSLNSLEEHAGITVIMIVSLGVICICGFFMVF